MDKMDGAKDERENGAVSPQPPVAEKLDADDEKNSVLAAEKPDDGGNSVPAAEKTDAGNGAPISDDKQQAAAPSVENTVVESTDTTTEPVSVESDSKLVEAMSAASISAADEAPPTLDAAKENAMVVVEGSADASGDECEDRVVEQKDDGVKSQDTVPNSESQDDEELGQDGEDEIKDPDAPVPVDNDTNDPQYIPRRGRFYEHDDRMAYSTTSSECSESNSDDDIANRPPKKHNVDDKKPIAPVETVDNDITPVAATAEIAESVPSTKKVLAISKVVSAVVDSSNTTSGFVPKPGFGSKKSRHVDSLDKWTHDKYNEHEQSPKSKDELLASYGYDIREESEAPKARRHHKYGRAATTKYTRSWQDTTAYNSNTSGGQQSNKIKHSLNKNKPKPPASGATEYTSEFPSLDKSKPPEPPVESQNDEPRKQLKPAENKEKKEIVSATEPSRLQEPVPQITPKPKTPSTNHDSRLDQQNGGSQLPSHNKNYFNRPSPADPNKYSQNDQTPPSAAFNPYNPNHRPQNSNQGPPNNFKPTYFNNTQGNLSHQHPSVAPRSRHFQQNHNSPQQFNRDRYFSKGSGPNQLHIDQSRHNNMNSVSAGTGRTQHGQYHMHFENNGSAVPMQTPIVRSSKRYSVQSRRELPEPVLNFGNMSKTQQQNGLLVQDQPPSTLQQMQNSSQVMQQQATMQMHQQLQQYHQPMQQLHHHSMVLDHNTGMMVMADPSMYHQLYATPQYGNAVAPGSAPGGNVDDPNAAAAASALQMLATQAAVYQPVPTGLGSPSNTQPESFMTTYYQPLQQPAQQPPPRRVNLAIPIVAPPVPNQQQTTQKTNTSSTN